MISFKKCLLAAGLIYIAFCQLLYAQSTNTYPTAGQEIVQSDTLVIYPGGDVQVWISGRKFNRMLTYTRADSIKNLFLEDFSKAYGTQSPDNQPVRVHYLVHGNGRRRLKAAASDPSDEAFDLAYEQQRLNQNLPARHYIFYDLQAGIQIHFLFESPEQISLLDEISLAETIRQLSNKNLKLSRTTRIEMYWENNNWKTRKPRNTTIEMLEISPNIGVGLLGSQWSGIGGGDISLIFVNKYKVSRYRITAGITEFLLTDFTEGRFNHINFNSSVDFRLGLNTSLRNKPRWTGIQAGYFFNAQNNADLQGRFKIGIYSEGITPFQYAFDLIPLSRNRMLYSVTMKFPF